MALFGGNFDTPVQCNLSIECPVVGRVNTSPNRIGVSFYGEFNGILNFPNDANIYDNTKFGFSFAFGDVYHSSNFDSVVRVPYEKTINVYSMFENCIRYNKPFNVPITPNNYRSMFYDCVNLDSAITINNDALCEDMGFMFWNCIKFNKPINIPTNVTNMVFSFYQCFMFNQPITFPAALDNAMAAFYNAKQFNQTINLPEGTNCVEEMLYNCTHFDAPVTISGSVTDAISMLNSCSSYNSPLTINSSDVPIICIGMLHYDENFNASIELGNRVISGRNMFYDAYSFNQPVYLDLSGVNVSKINVSAWGYEILYDYSSMFALCNNLNSPIDIIGIDAQGNNSKFISFLTQCSNFNAPVNVSVHNANNVSFEYALYDDRLFNSPVNFDIEANIVNFALCFWACTNFNQSVVIPNNSDCSSMFTTCTNLNKPILFPESTISVNRAFEFCKNFNQDIYVPDSVNMNYISMVHNAQKFTHAISVPTSPTTQIIDQPNSTSQSTVYATVPNFSYSGIGLNANTLGAKVTIRDLGQTATVVSYQYKTSSGGTVTGYIWDKWLQYRNHI